MNQNKSISIPTVIMVIPLGLILLALFISVLPCNGWNAGSMSGVCTLEFLTPFYNYISGMLMFISFMAYLWLPVIIVAYIISIIKIVKQWRINKDELFSRHRFDLSVAIIWTVIFSYICINFVLDIIKLRTLVF